jgi:hypothetical protein
MHKRDPSRKIIFSDLPPQLLDGVVQRMSHLYLASILQLPFQRCIQRVRKDWSVYVRDRPHCRDDALEAGRKHSRREVDGFLRQLLVALRRLARGQDRQLGTVIRHCNQSQKLEPTIVQAERALRWIARVVLNAVASEMDPSVLSHRGDDVFDRRVVVSKVRDTVGKVSADGNCFVGCAGKRRLPRCCRLRDDEDMRLIRVAATRDRYTRMRLDESCE